MKFVFIGLAVLFTFQVQAQELTKVVNFISQKKEKEEYFALKTDKKTKHGKYKRIDTYSGFVLEEGYYKQNQKDSLWVEYLQGTQHKLKEGYYYKGQKNGLWRECEYTGSTIYLKEKGAYKEGFRVGPWPLFNKEGETIEVYDYSRDSLLFVKPPADTVKYAVWLENTWQKQKLDRAAGIMRDKYGKDLMASLYYEIRYPIQAARDGAEGIVLIACSVNENGDIENFIVEKKIHPLLDAEALRVAKLTKLKFYPALLNGKPVTTKVIFPFVFHIR